MVQIIIIIIIVVGADIVSTRLSGRVGVSWSRMSQALVFRNPQILTAA